MKLIKFVERKISKAKEWVLPTFLTIPLVFLLFFIAALPGAIIAFLLGYTDSRSIRLAGLLSWIAIMLIIATVQKVKNLIEEYKNFSE